MGQYHVIVNPDKGECIMPWPLGSGAKQWEQAANHFSTPVAMFVLMCQPEARGGGDLGDAYTNEDGVNYVGRWHGDRVLIVGDYAEKDDIAGVNASDEYRKAVEGDYVDISAAVLEMLNGIDIYHGKEKEYMQSRLDEVRVQA